MKNLIEKTGTGIEKTGTGIERTGTGIERTGTGIERTGTGIERTGTGISAMLVAVVCALTMFTSSAIAGPRIANIGGLTISTTDTQVSVSWHKALGNINMLIMGMAELGSDYVAIPLYSYSNATNAEKVAGGGTGNGADKVAGGGTGNAKVSSLEPWGEMELSLNEDGSIEGVITGFSYDKGMEEFIFKAGNDTQFLMPVFEELKN